MSQNYTMAHVKERTVGILFFSIFGALWLLVSLLAFRALTRWTGLLLLLRSFWLSESATLFTIQTRPSISLF